MTQVNKFPMDEFIHRLKVINNLVLITLNLANQ